MAEKLILLAVVIMTAGCATLVPRYHDPIQYPYQGTLLDGNGHPVQPPRWQ